jgi:hypothetical protein
MGFEKRNKKEKEKINESWIFQRLLLLFFFFLVFFWIVGFTGITHGNFTSRLQC